MTTATTAFTSLIEAVRTRADAGGVFGDVSVRDGVLVCRAKASAEPASYRLAVEDGALWVKLVMADRWQSESIEADLMHTGDKIEDLIREELVDLGGAPGEVRCEHFRSEDMLFTFRTPVPVPPERPDVEVALRYLLAYEACFRNLGDMSAGE